MLVRIVKMEFYKQNIEVFLKNFEANKKRIRGFNGCTFLELYRDKNYPSIFFTYSHWESEEDLERYRKSEVFNDVWSVTKPLFSSRPEAWSVDKLESLK
ncbi:antibiotic biosynthesis monooxygenase family protein [Algibacter aquimarinus]|uniref:Antibiotic biosynthesis monooxygenase n=1 Tax=Algibacter aquimarinus TaxID=1136748 RepID=A0ABP9HQF9_9FLAO